jgi:formylglycine-generating enzyme required for sulfatase activity
MNLFTIAAITALSAFSSFAFAGKDRGGAVALYCSKMSVELADVLGPVSKSFRQLTLVDHSDEEKSLAEILDVIEKKNPTLGKIMRQAKGEITYQDVSDLPLLGDDGISDPILLSYCQKIQIGVQTFRTGVVEVNLPFYMKLSSLDRVLFKLHEIYLRVMWREENRISAGGSESKPNVRLVREKIKKWMSELDFSELRCRDRKILMLQKNSSISFCRIPPSGHDVLLGGINNATDEHMGPTGFWNYWAIPHYGFRTLGFAMGEYEITNNQFRSVMGYLPTNQSSVLLDPKLKIKMSQHKDAPVVNVTLEEAHAFAAKLNQLDSSGHYRVPMDSEWEYAAKGGAYVGYGYYLNMPNDEIIDLCRIGFHKKCGVKTREVQPVHSCSQENVFYRAPKIIADCTNAYGLAHVVGNAEEWTSSPLQQTDAAWLRKFNYSFPLPTSDSVWIRGGGIDSLAPFISTRAVGYPTDRSLVRGFRILRESVAPFNGLIVNPTGSQK